MGIYGLSQGKFEMTLSYRFETKLFLRLRKRNYDIKVARLVRKAS